MGDEDEEVSSRGTDTDKAWPCLQYLLAKAGASIEVIGGGEPVTDDVWGYDSPRLLTVDDVVDYYGHLVWLFHAAATDREPILVWLD